MKPRQGRLESPASRSQVVESLRRHFFQGPASLPFHPYKRAGRLFAGEIGESAATIYIQPVRLDLKLSGDALTAIEYSLSLIRPQAGWLAHLLPLCMLLILISLGLGADGRGVVPPDQLGLMIVLGLAYWVVAVLMNRWSESSSARVLESTLQLSIRRAVHFSAGAAPATS